MPNAKRFAPLAWSRRTCDDDLVARSKKFRGKLCAYCGRPSTGPDHVIGRGFFLPEDRRGSRTTDACTVSFAGAKGVRGRRPGVPATDQHAVADQDTVVRRCECVAHLMHEQLA